MIKILDPGNVRVGRPIVEHPSFYGCRSLKIGDVKQIYQNIMTGGRGEARTLSGILEFLLKL